VRRGYTLIETAVVLLVLALAAGITAPAIGRGLDAIRVRAEVAGVVSFLRAARERAISQHRTLAVALDGEGQALVLTAGDPDPLRAPGGDFVVRRLPPPMRLAAEPPQARTVTFFAHGLSSGGRFRLETAGTVYVVAVDPLTGRVTTHRSPS
jgi:prepilin-type N-terminal cleavage/methylation domain-containing protein